MVDISSKKPTRRKALASAYVRAREETLTKFFQGRLPKGDALTAATLAGILAAKKTSELIPLAHPISLEHVEIDFERVSAGSLRITAEAKTTAPTGVEMEAMTAAVLAALVIYDMCKGIDPSIEIGPVRLERKEGGRSGTWKRVES